MGLKDVKFQYASLQAGGKSAPFGRIFTPMRRKTQKGVGSLAGSGKKKRKKKTGYNRLGMLTIAVTVLMLLGILMMQSRDISDKIAVYDARAAALEQDLEEQKSRTKEIDKYKAYMKTDEYAEQVARERLGLVKDNEIIFEEEK